MKSHSTDEIVLLKKQISTLKLIIGLFTACLFLLFVYSFTLNINESKHFKELSVENLKIVSPEGQPRIMMTHQIGSAPFNGKEFNRNVPPDMAGIIYLNPDGNEVGGIGWAGDESRTFAINALDYTGIPLEAIGFNRIQNEQTKSANLIIMDNPREDVDIDYDKLSEEVNSKNYGEEVVKLQNQMIERVRVGVENHVASFSMSDNAGNTRIKLIVDDDDMARIVIFDKEGNEIASIPE